MSVSATRVTVGTTATPLFEDTEGGGEDRMSFAVTVPTGGATLVLGGDDVTTANGFEVAPGATFSADVAAREVVYGIVASGTQEVQVIRIGIG